MLVCPGWFAERLGVLPAAADARALGAAGGEWGPRRASCARRIRTWATAAVAPLHLPALLQLVL